MSLNVLTTYASTWSKARAAHAELFCVRRMCYDKTKAAGRSAEKTCPFSGDPNIHTSQSVWYNYWTSAYKNSDVKSGPAETVPVMGSCSGVHIHCDCMQ